MLFYHLKLKPAKVIFKLAIARYVTLGMKELQSLDVVWLSMAALVLAIATVIIRAGHFYWPYKSLGDE